MTLPNTGTDRPRMPWDDIDTPADRLVDQGVDNYHVARQQVGSEVVGTTVVLDELPVHPSATTDLVAYLGPETNFKSGELGAGWNEPENQARLAELKKSLDKP